MNTFGIHIAAFAAKRISCLPGVDVASPAVAHGNLPPSCAPWGPRQTQFSAALAELRISSHGNSISP